MCQIWRERSWVKGHRAKTVEVTLSLATQCMIAEGFLSWSRSFSKLLPYAKYRKVRLGSML